MAAVVRPFRGLRPVPTRVDPGALVADGAGAGEAALRDPRNVAALLSADASRARFLVAEQLRSGVMSRDRLPSLYVLKLQAPEGPRTGFFAVVRADSVDVGDVGGDAVDAAALVRLKGFGVAIEPVVISYVDKKGRVARSLESETEREPDASFTWNQQACELWAVDDDSAAARVTALLEGAALTVKQGGSALARQRGLVSDDRASGFALAFFVDDEAPVARAPLGVVLHSIEGIL